MKSVLFILALVSACASPSGVIPCEKALERVKSTGLCHINGSIEQDLDGFLVISEDMSPDDAGQIVLSHTGDYADDIKSEKVGSIQFCGPYEVDRGGLMFLDVPFNVDGGFEGNVKVDRCDGRFEF